MYEYSAEFCFYGELTDFFRSGKKPEQRVYNFHGNPSVKDAIEAQGVPHTEVSLIVVNDGTAGFDYNLSDGDRVDVFPVSGTNGRNDKLKLRGEPELKFLIDVHLGKLARLMRLMGFDCLYRNDYNDHEIAALAKDTNRIVLTRDRRLLRFSVIEHGYWLRSVHPDEQAIEVIRRFNMQDYIDSFNRCLECNGEIRSVSKESVINRLEPKTILFYEDFYKCENCGKVYWKGSHYDHMQDVLKEFTD